MTKLVVFIQGAGTGAYKEDALLAQSLQDELGSEYDVVCPKMPDEANAPYDAWKREVQQKLQEGKESTILVGHSIGASHLVKILTEIEVDSSVAGVFLLDAPFWGGDGWRYEGYAELVVSKDAALKFPQDIKTFLYHTRDDEVVPFDHLALYAKLLPQATVREIDQGGHQLRGDMSIVANDIRKL